SRKSLSPRKVDTMSATANSQAAVQLPRWRSHKEVYADKIIGIERKVDDEAPIMLVRLSLACRGYAEFAEDAAIFKRGMPEVGWYYVVYPDGYKSLSPAQAFEE